MSEGMKFFTAFTMTSEEIRMTNERLLNEEQRTWIKVIYGVLRQMTDNRYCQKVTMSFPGIGGMMLAG